MRYRDEKAFDDRFRTRVGDDARFVYCRAGGTLGAGWPKGLPFAARNPSTRAMHEAGEHLKSKLQRQDSGAILTVAGNEFRNLYRAITHLYAQDVRSLRGQVEQRVDAMAQDVLVHDRADRAEIAAEPRIAQP